MNLKTNNPKYISKDIKILNNFDNLVYSYINNKYKPILKIQKKKDPESFLQKRVILPQNLTNNNLLWGPLKERYTHKHYIEDWILRVSGNQIETDSISKALKYLNKNNLFLSGLSGYRNNIINKNINIKNNYINLLTIQKNSNSLSKLWLTLDNSLIKEYTYKEKLNQNLNNSSINRIFSLIKGSDYNKRTNYSKDLNFIYLLKSQYFSRSDLDNLKIIILKYKLSLEYLNLVKRLLFWDRNINILKNKNYLYYLIIMDKYNIFNYFSVNNLISNNTKKYFNLFKVNSKELKKYKVLSSDNLLKNVLLKKYKKIINKNILKKIEYDNYLYIEYNKHKSFKRDFTKDIKNKNNKTIWLKLNNSIDDLFFKGKSQITHDIINKKINKKISLINEKTKLNTPKKSKTISFISWKNKYEKKYNFNLNYNYKESLILNMVDSFENFNNYFFNQIKNDLTNVFKSNNKLENFYQSLRDYSNNYLNVNVSSNYDNFLNFVINIFLLDSYKLINKENNKLNYFNFKFFNNILINNKKKNNKNNKYNKTFTWFIKQFCIENSYLPLPSSLKGRERTQFLITKKKVKAADYFSNQRLKIKKNNKIKKILNLYNNLNQNSLGKDKIFNIFFLNLIKILNNPNITEKINQLQDINNTNVINNNNNININSLWHSNFMNFFYSKFKLKVMKENLLLLDNNINYKVKMFEQFNKYFYLVYSDINNQLGKLEEIFNLEAIQEKAKLIKEKEVEKDTNLNDLINYNNLSFKSKLLLKIDREKEIELKNRSIYTDTNSNSTEDSLINKNIDNNYIFNIFSSSQPEDHLWSNSKLNDYYSKLDINNNKNKTYLSFFNNSINEWLANYFVISNVNDTNNKNINNVISVMPENKINIYNNYNKLTKNLDSFNNKIFINRFFNPIYTSYFFSVFNNNNNKINDKLSIKFYGSEENALNYNSFNNLYTNKYNQFNYSKTLLLLSKFYNTNIKSNINNKEIVNLRIKESNGLSNINELSKLSYIKNLITFNSSFLHYNKFIGFNNNSNNNKLIDNIYDILYYTFRSMSSLISKPIITIKNDKITIHLFYYLIAPFALKKIKPKYLNSFKKIIDPEFNKTVKYINKNIKKKNKLNKINRKLNSNKNNMITINNNSYNNIKFNPLLNNVKADIYNKINFINKLNRFTKVISSNKKDTIEQNINLFNFLLNTMSPYYLQSKYVFKKRIKSNIIFNPFKLFYLVNKINNIIDNNNTINNNSVVNNITEDFQKGMEQIFLNKINNLFLLTKENFYITGKKRRIDFWKKNDKINKPFLKLRAWLWKKRYNKKFHYKVNNIFDRIKKYANFRLINPSQYYKNNWNLFNKNIILSNNKNYLNNFRKERKYKVIFLKKKLIKKNFYNEIQTLPLNFVFKEKFEALCFILSKLTNKKIELNLIRVHYPHSNANILVNFLEIIARKLWRKKAIRFLFNNAYLKNFFHMNFERTDSQNIKYNDILPSFLTGLKIKICGRLYKGNMRVRKTVFNAKRGINSRGNLNFRDKARYTNKNNKGSYSISIQTSHNFFNKFSKYALHKNLFKRNF